MISFGCFFREVRLLELLILFLHLNLMASGNVVGAMEFGNSVGMLNLLLSPLLSPL